ncbi:MAG: sterol desaturase family protein [Polyangiales bacterium]
MSYALWLAAISAAFVVLERLAPRRPDPGALRPGVLTDAFYVVFNGHFLGLTLAVITVPAVRAVERAAASLGLASTLHARVAEGLSPLAQFALAFVLIDLLKWLIHNLLHRVPALWRFHQVHHSIERMDWLGSMRFHFAEALIYDGLLYVPLAVLGFRGEVLFALAVVGTAIGHFNHANLRVRIGPLRYLINSPEMHIWHHVHPDAGPPDRNFGINLAVWDWLFGTAYVPDHPPARLGFEGVERYPKNPLGQALRPMDPRAT